MTNPNFSLLGIGLMSGTSLDGLDIVACRYTHNPILGFNFELLQAQTIGWPVDLQKNLHEVYGGSAFELACLDHELGRYMGLETKRFCLENDFVPDFVGSHGHTVFHRPDLGFTIQIGNGAQISAACGFTVVSDFRSGDMGLGGQGAPLVPIGDLRLFAGHDLWLNLGGIGNITHRTSGGEPDDFMAFDIGPCCQVLNKLAGLQGFSYDKDGQIAAAGKPIHALLAALDTLDFYKQPAPKSLGREWVENCFWPVLEPYLSNYSLADLLSSATSHIAGQIAHSALQTGLSGSMLVSGGGAFNKTLCDLIQNMVGGQINLVLPDAQTIAFKEAIIFGFLGFLRLQNSPNCLAGATGANRNSVGGAVYRV